jgi:type IV pilus assembly protein PilM
MKWGFFQKLFSSKHFLGIDIGTYSIKIVEISQSGNKQKLENYGSILASSFYEKPFRTFSKNTILFSTQEIVEAIKVIIDEAKIKTKKAVFSIPDFSTLFTNFELPYMEKEELNQAVRYEARQHIPLPLKEVSLDWQIIKRNPVELKKRNSISKEKLKVLLVAASNKIIEQYQEIAQLSKLEIISLEAEVFSLMRALIKKDEKESIALIEIGATSTTCSIINEAKLENSYSLSIASNDFDKKIAEKNNIDYLEAEKLKKELGILNNNKIDEKNVREYLLPLIDSIIIEIEKSFNDFYQKGGKEIQKIILAGGAVLLPGLKEYFQFRFKKEVLIAQPFSRLDYPPILEKILKEMGPSYAIAIGTALWGLHSR